MKKTPTGQEAPTPKPKPKPKPADSGVNWAGHEFVKTIGHNTGRLQMRWLRSGSTLTIQALRYWFTYVNNRNKANINISVKANAAGEYKLNSPDSMQQKGVWLTWDTNGSLAVGNSTHITVAVTFIPDTGGPDDRGTDTHTFTI
jgi:hypothetical protein